jgi:methionine-rich copper-binding protein CopC
MAGGGVVPLINRDHAMKNLWLRPANNRALGVLLVVAGVVAACGGGGGSGGDAPPVNPNPPSATNEYWPMQVGNRWVYRYADGTAERQDVTGTEIVDGQTAWVVTTTGLNNQGTELTRYRLSGTAIVELADASDPFSRALGALELLRLPALAGSSFVQVNKVLDGVVDVDNDGRADPLTINSVATVIDRGAITVPAGTFNDAIHIQYRVQQSATGSSSGQVVRADFVADEWYAAGIGPVRLRVSTTAGGREEVTFNELEAYRVGAVASDLRAPLVVSRTPAAGSTVGLAVTVQLQVDEAMDPTAASLQALTVADATGKEVAQALYVIDGKQLRATLPVGLAGGSYSLRSDGSLRDAMGNVVQLGEWSFIIDATPPVLLSSQPAANATNVRLTDAIDLVFSEAVDLASVLRTVALRSTVTPLSLHPVEVTGQGDRAVRIRPLIPLEPLTDYYVDLETGLGDLFGNGTTASVRVPFRTASGLYAAPRFVGDNFGAVPVAVGDVNGDGRIDRVSLSSDGRAVRLEFQRSDGTLDAPVLVELQHPAFFGPSAMVVADVNGDGRKDVLVGLRESGVEVLLQDAQGRLVSTAFLASAQATVVRVADINGDGRLDVLGVRSEGDHVSVWLQRNDGTLGPETPVPWVHVGVVDMAVGDVDGDGRPDIALAASGQGPGFGVLLARQRPDGSFGAPEVLNVSSTFGARTVLIADLNGDGRSDLAAADSILATTVSFYLQQANGSFAPERLLTGFDRPHELIAADLNGDGRTDLVVAQSGLTPLVVLVQNAQGSLAMAQRVTNDLWPSLLYGTAVGDVNGDGRPDLLFAGGRVMFAVAPTVAASLGEANGQRAYRGLKARWRGLADAQRHQADTVASGGTAHAR